MAPNGSIVGRLRRLALRSIRKVASVTPGLAGVHTRMTHLALLKNSHLRETDPSSLANLLRIRVAHRPLNRAPLQPAREFLDLCRNLRLGDCDSSAFYYWIDPFSTTATRGGAVNIGNVTANYQGILQHGFSDLERAVRDARHQLGPNDFLEGQPLVLDGMRLVSRRIQERLAGDPLRREDARLQRAFQAMEDSPAESFHQGLQRILFLNQLLWQCGHLHNGLGRLDQQLLQLYRSDVQKGILSRRSAMDLLRDFLCVLHRDYDFKSGTLLGDTGQIIVAAGVLQNGDDASNELTELLLEAVGSLHQTEPKILLRVGARTPRSLMECSVDCLRQRTGSPLYSNDEVVVPLLQQFGFSLLDARDYASAACWEPLVPGKSLDQGNLGSLNFLSVLPPALLETPDLRDESDFFALLKRCTNRLVRETEILLERMDHIRWKPAPLMSLFMDDCVARGRDLSQGGAIHNNYGFTTVGLPNLVDSLLNLRRFVLGGTVDFQRLKNALQTNFQGEQGLCALLRDQPVRFGSDQPQVLELSKLFTDAVDQVLHGRRNRLGGGFKFGLSSPDYVTSSRSLPATPDGRCGGERLKTHISGSGIEGACFTDLVRFAGKLDYQGHRFNGNVVDFILDPALVDAPQDRFADFLEGGVRCGFFQMQMTIVDSATIRAALDNPEKFPDLIVRVWGFSAYFKDLPQEYRQVVLERTLCSEAARR